MFAQKRWIAWLLVLILTVALVGPASAAVPEYDESSYTVQQLEEIDFGTINFNKDWKFYLSTAVGEFVEEIVVDGEVQQSSIKGGLKDGAEGPQTAEIIRPDFDDSSWRTVEVPHDWSFEFTRDKNAEGTTSGTGYLPGGVGFYRKTFVVPASYEGKKISVDFDGVYMNAAVYVNGELVGEYPSGYLGFTFDISDYLRYGEENVIVVRCSDKPASSRWYTGHGIYRDVNLLVDTQTRFVRNSVYLFTPTIGETYPSDGTAELNVTAELYSVNDVENASVVTTLYDANGEVYATTTSDAVALVANEKLAVADAVTVEDPLLWSCDTPNMYTAVVELYDGDQLVDSYETPFGFKWFDVSATEGFSLNGETVLLKGVNLHHDNGLVGTASEPDALDRKVKLMKDMGVNAIRTSHNPESQQFIDACNKYGILVLEESADFVSGGKGGYNWAHWFNDEVPADWAGAPDGGYPTVTLAADGTYKEAPYCWGDQHIQEMILRHRNNPCILGWSIANELRSAGDPPAWATQELINDLYGTEFDPEPTWGINTEVIRLGQRALQVDPYHKISQATDALRAGVESSKETYGDQWIHVCEYLDSIGGILGTQYSVQQTLLDIREHFPTLAMMETESAHGMSGRGSYYGAGDLSVNTDSTAGRVGGGGYGNNNLRLSPTREYCLKYIRDYGNINGGMFVWSGIDYIGEGQDNAIDNAPDIIVTGHQGLVDFAGIPKDIYYLFQSQWTDKDTAPMVYLMPQDWNAWTEGEEVAVYAYSNCPSVELFLNGESLGVREFTRKVTDFGVEYYETSEPTQDDGTNETDVNTGGYVSPNGEYGKLHLEWTVPYATGELKAVAYDEDGSILAEDVINTFGMADGIKLEPDKLTMEADGEGMIYVTASIVDENGVLCRDADDLLQFEAEGAKIAGISNGYQGEWEPWKYGGTQFSYYTQHLTFLGQVVFALKSEDAGKVTIKAYGEDLEPEYLTVYAVDSEQSDVAGYADVDLRVAAGEALQLPEQVTAILVDGSTREETAQWIDVPETLEAGEYEFTAENGAVARVTAYEVASVDPCELNVYGDIEPVLPEFVHVTYTDGVTGYLPVTWDGTTGVVEGTDIPAEAVIDHQSTAEAVNLADPTSFELSSTANYTSGSKRQPSNTLDGNMESCWDNRVASTTSLSYNIAVAKDTSLDMSYIELEWADYQTFNSMDIYYVIGEMLPDLVQEISFYAAAPTVRYADLPASIVVDYWNGEEWVHASNSTVSFADESLEATTVSFDPITTQRVRIYMFNDTPHTPDGTIQIAEIEVYAK